MGLTLTIAGVDRTAKFWLPDVQGEVSATLMAGSRSSLRLKVFDVDGAGGFRPAIDDSVVLTDSLLGDVFAGLIDEIEEEGLTDLDTGLRLSLTVSDWWIYCERVAYTKTYPAGTTLKAVLQDLVANPLASFGITLDAGQAVGDTFATELTFVAETIDGILGRLTTVTGWVPRISTAKVLKMIAPAGESCGFALADASSTVVGRVTVRQSRNAQYANRIILTCGGNRQVSKSQNFTDPGTAAAEFVVNYPASQNINDPFPNQLIVAGVNQGPVGWGAGYLPPPAYYWDAVNHKLVRESGAPTFAGQTITVAYTAQFPFEATYNDAAEQAAHGVWEKRVNDEKTAAIASNEEAAAYAAAVARQAVALPRVVSVQHAAGLAYVGQSIGLSFADRGVAGTHMVTSADFHTVEDGSLEFALTCVSGTELQASWLDFFRGLTSGGGTAAGSSGGGAVSVMAGAALSSPFPLGGSRNQSLPVGVTFTAVVDWLPFVCLADVSVKLRVTTRGRDAGPAVTPRLARYDGGSMTWVAHTVGVPVAGTAESEQEVLADLVAGQKLRLEYATDTPGASAYCIGQLENQ